MDFATDYLIPTPSYQDFYQAKGLLSMCTMCMCLVHGYCDSQFTQSLGPVPPNLYQSTPVIGTSSTKSQPVNTSHWDQSHQISTNQHQ